MEYMGKCFTMCPEKEFIFRKHHRLMHILEFPPVEEFNWNYEKVKMSNCVKEFRRSAAGENVSDLKNLRPSSILLLTTKYLFGTVMNRVDHAFVIKYDFIFDRLRSVRQDAVIQRLESNDPKSLILILERCVRFYLYAAYEAQIQPQLKIDIHINRTHLNDCLRSLFELYCANPALVGNEVLSSSSMTATYILLHLSEHNTVRSVLEAHSKLLQTTSILSIAIRMYIAFHNKNYIRFNKLLVNLITAKDFLSLFALSTIVNDIRFEAITLLCHSHSSKSFTFNANDLCKWLLLLSNDDVMTYCASLGLVTTDDDSIKFLKSNIPPKIVNFHENGCRIFNVLEKLQNEKLSMYLLNRDISM